MKQALETLCARNDLGPQKTFELFQAVVEGRIPTPQLAGFLMAFRVKGETPAEVAAAARALLSAAAPFPRPEGLFADTAGTGGDGLGTINVSTAVAFVAAACGLPVAKHGNRAVSSHCGSADVLEALGARIDLDAAAVRRVLDDVGVGFLFAPLFQPGLKHAVAARQALGVRTVMNRLGPLVNPARPPVQVTGVYDEKLVRPTAETLAELGVQHALVVHGGGMDELALHATTRFARLNNGAVEEGEITPEQAGVSRAPLEALQGGTPQANAEALRQVLGGAGPQAHRDAVALNSGALLFTAGRAASIAQGVAQAQASMAEGKPAKVLNQFVEATHA